jgi:phosphate transport system permease protein
LKAERCAETAFVTAHRFIKLLEEQLTGLPHNNAGMPGASAASPRFEARISRQQMLDNIFDGVSRAFAFVVLVVLCAIIVSLFYGAWPALHKFSYHFLFADIWNPVTDEYGALAAIYGTLVTAVIAMVLGVPISFGIAIFLTELCPPILKRPIGIAIELLAGVPSIIYGIWGLFVFAPVLQHTVQPVLIGMFDGIPGLERLFAGPPFGIGILTAGLILAVMVLPFVTSVTRDVFETVPPMLKESAYGLGATTAEVVWKVVIPYTRVGLVGGVMLGLGRALGETMAVTFVIGNAHRISPSLLAPGTTIAASIANEFTEAVGDLYTSALIALGLLLFFITFTVLAFAKLMLIRMQRERA